MLKLNESDLLITTSLNNYVKEGLHIDESTKTDYPALLLYGTFLPSWQGCTALRVAFLQKLILVQLSCCSATAAPPQPKHTTHNPCAASWLPEAGGAGTMKS